MSSLLRPEAAASRAATASASSCCSPSCCSATRCVWATNCCHAVCRYSGAGQLLQLNEGHHSAAVGAEGEPRWGRGDEERGRGVQVLQLGLTQAYGRLRGTAIAVPRTNFGRKHVNAHTAIV